MVGRLHLVKGNDKTSAMKFTWKAGVIPLPLYVKFIVCFAVSFDFLRSEPNSCGSKLRDYRQLSQWLLRCGGWKSCLMLCVYCSLATQSSSLV